MSDEERGDTIAPQALQGTPEATARAAAELTERNALASLAEYAEARAIAKQAYDTLDTALRAGDPVESAAIVAAEAALRVATIRHEAATRRVADAVAAVEAAALAELIASIPARLDRARLDKARAAFTKAAGEWFRAARAHDDEWQFLQAALNSAGALPAGVVVEQHRTIHAGTATYSRVNVQFDMLTIQRDLFQESNPRTTHRFNP